MTLPRFPPGTPEHAWMVDQVDAIVTGWETARDAARWPDLARSTWTPTRPEDLTMYPHHFADLLKQWLADAQHPGITQVRTCADVGWHTQPIGVVLDLSDGWRFIAQCVGTSPDGGNANRDPNYPPPALPEGSWEDDPAYIEARRKFDTETRAYSGPKTRSPQAPPQALMAVAHAVTKQAGHDGIRSAELPPERSTLSVTCTDGSKVHVLAAGYLAPGEPKLAHPAHAIPAEWCREPANVS